MLTGIFGAVNGVSTNRTWGVSKVGEPRTYRASNTHGGTGREKGVVDWTGSFGAYGGSPLILPGQQFTFKGYTAPNTGVEGTAGPTYTGLAIADSLSLALNWAGGEPPSYTVNFSAMGELTEADEIVIDATEPDITEFKVPRIEFDEDGSSGSAGFQEWCNLLTATLTLTSENKPFVDSCTNGGRQRDKGPKDWTLSLSMRAKSLALIPFDVGDDIPLRIYTSETEFWRLRWGHIISFQNLTVPTESGDFITVGVEIGMNGFLNGGVGTVVSPSNTTWWGTP